MFKGICATISAFSVCGACLFLGGLTPINNDVVVLASMFITFIVVAQLGDENKANGS